MDRHWRNIWRGFAHASASMLCAAACTAQAQTSGGVNDYQLPAAPRTAAPSVSGPVDPENPVATPRTAAPSPTAAAPQPVPPPAPQITLPSAPTSPPASPPPARSPRTEANPAATPTAFAPPEPPPSTSAAPLAYPTASPGTEAMPAPSAETAESEPPRWPWIVGGVLLFLLLAGIAFRLFQRAKPAPEPETADPAGSTTGPEPSAPAALPKRPVQPVQPVSPASPAPDPASQPIRTMAGPLELSFEARHFSQAMVNASIAYRLLLTNTGEAPLGPLRVTADLTSAHGSLSADQLFNPDGPDIEPAHELPGLAPGETREFKGELRLPLAAILPVHQGAARLFVPLARLRIGGDAIDIIRVFVVGQSSGQPDGPLKPFPLDRGPGMIRDIGQREVSPST